MLRVMITSLILMPSMSALAAAQQLPTSCISLTNENSIDNGSGWTHIRSIENNCGVDACVVVGAYINGLAAENEVGIMVDAGGLLPGIFQTAVELPDGVKLRVYYKAPYGSYTWYGRVDSVRECKID